MPNLSEVMSVTKEDEKIVDIEGCLVALFKRVGMRD